MSHITSTGHLRSIHWSILALAICALPLALPDTAAAKDSRWAQTGGGRFETFLNWTNGVPDEDTNAIFDRGNSAIYLINFTRSETVNSVLIGANDVTFDTLDHAALNIGDLHKLDNNRGLMVGMDTGDIGELTSNLMRISANAATLGYDTNSQGTLNIYGGMLNLAGRGFQPYTPESVLTIGRYGDAVMRAGKGASVNVAGTTSLAVETGSSGTLVVRGRSTWTNAGELLVGGRGDATLTVRNNATFGAADVTIARRAGSSGVINVIGPGASLTGDVFTFGPIGSASMNISGGGMVQSSQADIYYRYATPASINITGEGSTWDVGQLNLGLLRNLPTTLGADVFNTISVKHGGSIISDNINVSTDGGTSDKLVVTGPTSSLLARSMMHIGTDGDAVNAVVAIKSNATLTVGDRVLVDQTGDLFGHGTINGDVVNKGNVQAGYQGQTLQVNGDYLQTERGEFTLSSDGIHISRMRVSGSVSLEGTLNIERLVRLNDNINGQFLILSGASITGQFNDIDPGSFTKGYKLIYEPTRVWLSISDAQPIILAGSAGFSPAAGSLSLQAIPEPGTLLLLLVPAVGLIRRRRLV